jgi:serine/threonine protein kinase
MAIQEFAIQRLEAGDEEQEGDLEEAPTEVVEVEPVETKSRLERRFKVIRHLKEDGGMAEVYLAQDNETGKQVIWKQAAPDRKTTLSTVNEAIENEAEMLQAMSHPRIPEFIDSGKIINDHEELVNVLVMQFIEGNSLDQELSAMANAGLNMPFDRISTILLQLCETLEHLGDMDPPVYHRDVKPHNVMMTPYSGAFLIDFGLAKGVDAGRGTSLSGGNHTPGWAPPERENGVTGPTTDVYSLGQLLWHMLTNERPGVIGEEQRLTKMDEMGHPDWLGELVNYATVPHSTDERIQSVTEFRIRLENQGEMPDE